MPLESRGIFRYTRNGMYTFGLIGIWLPGLFLASQAALLAAAFHHAAAWVRYYCTELPDMRRIYGNV
ncbi:MAG: methyltransferase [Bryobacterales bacterium]